MDLRHMPKSRSNVLAGVAGGIAEYQEISPVTARVFFVLTALVTGGLAFILYTVLAFVMPPPRQ